MNSKRGRFTLLFLAILIIGGIWFMFLRSTALDAGDAAELLAGKWQRTDGPYTIEIVEVKDEGIMTALYFNPGPINVGKSGWRVKDEKLQVFVELQDKNYPGSLYTLNYDEKSDLLSGTYFQAGTKESFSVTFNKVK